MISATSVQPAAVLCEVAKESDARLVIVNAEPTPYDTIADAVTPGRLGEVVPSLLSILARPRWALSR